MNVEIGTETPTFLFWEYLFRKFGILSLQCVLALRPLSWSRYFIDISFQNKYYFCRNQFFLDDISEGTQRRIMVAVGGGGGYSVSPHTCRPLDIYLKTT
jgi:hypothetical protein